MLKAAGMGSFGQLKEQHKSPSASALLGHPLMKIPRRVTGLCLTHRTHQMGQSRTHARMRAAEDAARGCD